jgi:filamentous hemagglutinin family protein
MPRVGSAQHITIDGRLSPAQTLVGPNYTIGANLGKQVGSNLFHSFGQFSLANTPVPESATFTPTGSTGPISNVIGRVTGSNQSNINGAIVSAIPGANLYLINPSGIVFGPHATVNVSGSFQASTADYLKMSDGAKFQATNLDASTLSAAPPAAFGFLTATPAQISVNRSTLGPVPGTLGLVGGPVAITGGMLSAPAGTVQVTSAAGVGEVPVDPRNTPALTVTSFGPVAVKGGSTLDVSDPINLGSGGSVFIRSGTLTIDASEINTDNYGPGAGGTLFLGGEDQVTFSNGAYVHAMAYGSGSGAGAMISTASAGTLTADASTVVTSTSGPGNGGALSVETGRLTVTNRANVLTLSDGSGAGGALVVSVGGAVTVDSGSSLGTQALASGKAGDVSVTAAGPVAIDMSVGAGTSILGGIASGTGGAGIGGNVSVTAEALAITNNGAIAAVTLGSGNSGDISVHVSGTLSISSPSGNPRLGTGILAQALPGSRGNVGKVSVTAGTLSLDSNGQIQSATAGAGNAGNVSVTCESLTITNNGVIVSGTQGAGNGSDVSVNVSGMLSISSPKGDPRSATGILAQSSPGSGGKGGNVSVTAGTLSIASNSEIAAGTFGSGNGGNISVKVAGQLTLDGSGASAPSQASITSQADPGSLGNAGNVTVTAGALSIISRGVISSSTSGAGKSGNISVTVDGQLTIDGALSANSLTGITAEANPGSTGNAGAVSVSAGMISIANGGRFRRARSVLEPAASLQSMYWVSWR